MIISGEFKKGIVISVLWHACIAGVFSFSFGKKIPSPQYASTAFLGAILHPTDLIPGRLPGKRVFIFSHVPLHGAQTEALNSAKGEYTLMPSYALKPQVTMWSESSKPSFLPATTMLVSPVKKKEAVIMFYPPLPYHFLLYFKDRQEVHIELLFNLVDSGIASSVTVKRKISSGNLEADLLSMRYISRYLFIEQAKFLPNKWQTVKIDLRPKND